MPKEPLVEQTILTPEQKKTKELMEAELKAYAACLALVELQLNKTGKTIFQVPEYKPLTAISQLNDRGAAFVFVWKDGAITSGPKFGKALPNDVFCQGSLSRSKIFDLRLDENYLVGGFSNTTEFDY